MWRDPADAELTWFRDAMHFPAPVTPLRRRSSRSRLEPGVAAACATLVSPLRDAAPHRDQRLGLQQPGPGGGPRGDGRAHRGAHARDGRPHGQPAPPVGRPSTCRLVVRLTDEIEALDFAGGPDAATAAFERLREINIEIWRIHFLVVFPKLGAGERFSAIYTQVVPSADGDGALPLPQGVAQQEPRDGPRPVGAGAGGADHPGRGRRAPGGRRAPRRSTPSTAAPRGASGAPTSRPSWRSTATAPRAWTCRSRPGSNSRPSRSRTSAATWPPTPADPEAQRERCSWRMRGASSARRARPSATPAAAPRSTTRTRSPSRPGPSRRTTRSTSTSARSPAPPAAPTCAWRRPSGRRDGSPSSRTSGTSTSTRCATASRGPT